MKFDTERLLYRRQYILGPRFLVNRGGWKCLQIGDDLFATVHPDLETAQAYGNGMQLTLLGFLIDPFHPEYSNREVLQHISETASCFDEVIEAAERYGGRWIIICHDGARVRMFHDPCGLRQIFYTKKGGGLWCGSQPAILVDSLNGSFEQDEAALELVNSPQFDQTERAWPGDGTIYKSIKHLLPNHYLDVTEGQVVRYWPRKKLEPTSLDRAVQTAAAILRGSLAGAARRYELMMPVTAGWDSRTLLAVSREMQESIFYYVCQLSSLTSESPDIRIPSRLLPRLGLDFRVVACEDSMDPRFREVMSKSVTMARDLPKTFTIYHHYKHSQGKLNVCGNASEVARKSTHLTYRKKFSGRLLAKYSGYKGIRYVTSQYEKWLRDTEPVAAQYNLHVFDLFYWEQRMGNWGAMYPAEQDIAIEEFCPFNNRTLLEALLSVDVKYRVTPNCLLYQELIRHMWEGVLSEPINPLSLRGRVKRSLNNIYQRYVLR
ncbi:hypothetical protein ACI7RC_06445 [Brevibacillus sp. B_LB10_24]|uniref:hypothetical protein n=1 Tax=Brevibacillus sp. B_LB10_24 TaxID=3380645 RepID=UPI0038BC076C